MLACIVLDRIPYPGERLRVMNKDLAPVNNGRCPKLKLSHDVLVGVKSVDEKNVYGASETCCVDLLTIKAVCVNEPPLWM